MNVQIEPHTLQRAIERGATEDEIKDIIATGVNIFRKSERLGKSKVFPFQQYEIKNTMKKRNWKYIM